MTVHLDVVGERDLQPLRQGRGRGRLRAVGDDQRELVAAEARHECAVGRGAAGAPRSARSSASPVACPKTSLTSLKRSRSSAEHREAFLRRGGALQRRGETFGECGAVRQVGQRIMVRKMRDLHLGTPALGDVLMGRDPSAADLRLVGNRYDASVRTFPDVALGTALRERGAMLREVTIDIADEVSERPSPLEQFAQAAPGPPFLLRQAVHLVIALIAQQQPAIGAEQQQRLVHVVDGGVEQHVLLPQRLLGIADQGLLRLRELVRARGKPAVRDGAGEADSEHRSRGARDREGQRRRRQRKGGDDAGRIRNDLDRAHRGEMMQHDGEREQARRSEAPAHVFATQREVKTRPPRATCRSRSRRRQARAPT